MKKLKKLICLACVLMMCAAVLPAVSLAEEESGSIMYVSANQYVNMRDQANTTDSEIIAQVPDEAAVTVIGMEGNWVKVTYDGLEGFIYITYLTATNPNAGENETPDDNTGDDTQDDTPSTPVGTEAIIKNGPQKLLSAPQEGSTEIATYPVDTTVIVIFTTTTGWARVVVDDLLGYLPVSAFDEAAADEEDDEGNEEDGELPGDDEQPTTPPAAEFTLMKVKGGNLAFRSAAEKKASNIICFHRTGTEVKVFSINGAWAQVAVGEQIGYMMAAYLEPVVTQEDQPGEGEGEEDQPDSPVLPSEFTLMKVKGGNLAFRSAPEKKASNIICFHRTGTEVKVYSVENGWAHASVNGQLGYMMASYLEEVVTEEEQPDEGENEQPGEGEENQPSLPDQFTLMKVKGGNLALRSAAVKKASNIICFHGTGTLVHVYAINNGWAQVSVDGQQGYMMASYLEEVVTEEEQPDEGENEQPGEGGETAPEGGNDPAPAPTAKRVYHPKGSYVNFRSSASDYNDSNILGKIPSGASVEVISVGKLFTKIIYDGKTGYINSNYLR